MKFRPFYKFCVAIFLAGSLLGVPSVGHAAETGMIFVTNEKGHSVTVLDPETYEVIKTVETSRRPRDLRFNADHTLLYVACGDDDVIDVMREQAIEETQRIGGVAPLDESYLRASIPRLTWNRGVWLIILFIGALLTAFALEQYRDGPLTTAWLVLFIPLVISSGGNSGSQSATLIISALSAGHITPSDWMRIIARELAQGILLGVVLGLIGYLAALWLGPDNPQHVIHALTVPITVLLVVVAGTLMGAMLPLIFESIGWDPALMSTPFIAGIIDVVGIVIYMTVAILLISGAPV